MLIRVNKKISARTEVNYAIMAAGTISHLWLDEESYDSDKLKRRNHIRLIRDTSEPAVQDCDA